MNKEKVMNPTSGYVMLSVILVLFAISLFGFIGLRSPIFTLVLLFALFLSIGFFFVYPNGSRVMTLFGEYKGTVRTHGFYWVNPFYVRKKISLRARNFDSERLKVNDKLGNPINISVILVWRVKETYKAAFDVDIYENFVRVQTDAAVRKLANMYAYDNFDNDAEITLRSGMEEVNTNLEREVSERLAIAGIEVLEARIGYLAYASEIASAMLRRQQATAIVAARMKIVEGAVWMVEEAINQLNKREIVNLDEDKKAAMVSNLLTVLCADKDASPVINTGTLNH
ncbi:MAG: SPFH domain-containing protein [Bacteroidetes bacterium]|nr:SPFH domain-containing protein [Bacteroidota bacterium]MCB0802114.1 SPFH domain-containing protein [Flavobacteriales bacterium]NOG57797.1 SPFH domain-containing protein [Bacteroidota bacterium]